MERDLDSLFSDGLKKYSSPVPAEVWEGISHEIISKSGNNRWLVWIIIIGLGLSSIAFLWFRLAKDNSAETESSLRALAEMRDEIPDNSTATAYNDSKDRILVADVVFKTEGPGFNLKNPIDGTISLLTGKKNGAVAYFPGNIKKTGGQEKETLNRVSNISNNDLMGTKGKIASRMMRVLPVIRLNNLIDPYADYLLNRQKTLGDCYGGPRSRFSIEFNVALDYPLRSLSMVGATGEFVNYLDGREHTENEFISFNAGIKAAYIHASGFIAKSGFQYTQINERFLLVKENIIKIKTLITIDTLYNNNGTFTITRDTSIIEVLGREELKTINHFRMFDIPLIVGYKFRNLNYSLELNAGVLFNISTGMDGRILNKDLIPYYYGSKGDGSFTPYRTRVGVSLYGGVTFLMRLSDRLQLMLEPNGRYYLRSFSNSTYPLNQNYFVFGLSTGIRYYF